MGIEATSPAPTLGIVGLGYWGPNLARVLSDRDDATLAWVCDQRPDRLERTSRRYPGTRATDQIDHLLDDPELDAVMIATPVGTHFELARRALEAGKHTFVEKPLAASSAEAEELTELADERGLVLMGGYTFLYSPPVQAVKSLLERDVLGDVYFISSSRVNLGLHQSDVSVIWDLGPHDFSILRHWLGEAPETLVAVGRDAIVEGIADVAFVTATYASGTVANLEMSWLAPSKLRRTVLVGSEKMVVYEDGAPEPVRIFDHGVVYKDPDSFGEYQLSYRTGDILSPRVDTEEPLALEVADFLRWMRAGSAPSEHAELCCDVVRMIEAAESSLVEQGTPVRLDIGVGSRS